MGGTGASFFKVSPLCNGFENLEQFQLKYSTPTKDWIFIYQSATNNTVNLLIFLFIFILVHFPSFLIVSTLKPPFLKLIFQAQNNCENVCFSVSLRVKGPLLLILCNKFQKLALKILQLLTKLGDFFKRMTRWKERRGSGRFISFFKNLL